MRRAVLALALAFGALGPAARAIHAVTPCTARARAAEDVRALAAASGIPADAHGTLPDALACARRAASDGALLVVAGSLYLVGEARALLAGA